MINEASKSNQNYCMLTNNFKSCQKLNYEDLLDVLDVLPVFQVPLLIA